MLEMLWKQITKLQSAAESTDEFWKDINNER